MACEYEYYDELETYFPRLYCKIDGKYCIYSKKCLKVNKFISYHQEECYKMAMQEKKNIPNGSKYIEFERKGYLYIDIDDNHTVKVKNTLGDFDQDYVYIRDGIDGYEISLNPFEIKRNYTGKKSDEKRDKTR